MKKRKDKIHSQTIWKNKLLYLKKFFFFHLTNHSKNKIENKNYYNHFSTKNSLYSNNKKIKSEPLYDYICVVGNIFFMLITYIYIYMDNL